MIHLKENFQKSERQQLLKIFGVDQKGGPQAGILNDDL